MKRRQQSEDDEYMYATSRDEEDLETWFKQIGLRSADAAEALRICEAHYVHTVSDLSQIFSRGQLKELFPHPYLCGRIETQFRCVDRDGDTAMGVETPKPIHIKHDGVTVSCDVTPSTTVRQIKEYIGSNSCFGCSADIQQLVYCGRQLVDDKTVGSYRIEPYSCLYLIARKASSW